VRALAQQLAIKQNVSSAFHPQTDRLSERTNQWVEQYLRLTINSAQTDWSDWLGIATMVHNNHKNATINITPSEALLGYMPRLHPMDPPLSLNQHVEDRKQTTLKRHAQAIEAINRTARQTPPPQFQTGQEVWLEAKNLQLPFQTPKLAPKRHGPFRITKQILPCGVSTPTTRCLEDPQCVPCQPPHGISRNSTTQTQLHQTAPRTD
jgi:hypothetical protein